MHGRLLKLVIFISMLSFVSACSREEVQSPVVFEESVALLELEEESKESIYQSLDKQDYYKGDEGLPTAEHSHQVPLAAANDYEDLIELSFKQAQILYFGFDACPYCKSFIPKLNQLAKEAGLYYYYYDTDRRRNDHNFEDVMDHFDLETVPIAFIVTENKAVSKIDHQSTLKEIEDFVLTAFPHE